MTVTRALRRCDYVALRQTARRCGKMLAALQVVVIGFASVPDKPGTVPNVDCRTSTPFDHDVYGKGYVVCDLCGEAQRVYVEMSADTFKDLADYRAGSDFSVDVPGDCAPYKHVYLSYAVGSMHPPWDGRQFLGGSPGGYGRPHVDVHFSTLSVAERESRTGECTTYLQGPVSPSGEPILCNIYVTDEANLKFLNLPPSELTAGFSTIGTFGGASIKNCGTHMLPESDLAPGGPAHCTSTGQFGDWQDCNAQMMAAITGQTPVDHDCSCGSWEDGTSPVLNGYDGEVIGEEVMVAIGQLEMLRDKTLPNPYVKAFGPEGSAKSGGHVATSTMSALVDVEGESRWRMGLICDGMASEQAE